MDLETAFAFVEADAPRVTCRRHGVVVVAVPWARHDTRFTRAFEDQVIAPHGLKLSPEKTRVVSIDEGFDFLGLATRRVRGRDGRMVIHTYPSKRSLQTAKAKMRQITNHTGPDQLSHRVNRVVRGGTTTSATVSFSDVRPHYAYWRVVGWLRRKHRERNWGWLRRTYLKERWPAHAGVELINPVALGTSRYRYQGAQIPLPWIAGYVALRDRATAMDYLEGLIAR